MVLRYETHAGVDAGTGYIHTITGTAANVHDIEETHNLIHVKMTVPFTVFKYLILEFNSLLKSGMMNYLRNVEFSISTAGHQYQDSRE